MFNCESTGFATSDHVTSQLLQWRHRNGEIIYYYLVAYLYSYHEKAINALYELA